jgi:replicative DNA helicase
MMLGARLIREPLDVTMNIKNIVDNAGETLSKIVETSQKGALEHISKISERVFPTICDRMNGIKTVGYKIKDWNKLNQITHGFLPGQLIILAARPGVGKSALALNWLARACESGHKCALFSLEMSGEECFKRILADYAAADIRTMQEDRDTNIFARVKGYENTVKEKPIWISDRASITVLEIKSQIDKFILQIGHKPLVVIDYLQLITSNSNNPNKSEALRIAEITRSLKIIAKDCGVPIILLSQLNRDVEKRQGNRPQLSDLRDSGAIEQDADLVFFIHRDMKTNSENTDLILAKHRNGPIFDFTLKFYPGISRYEEIERQTNPDETSEEEINPQIDQMEGM